jgi:serine/threonine protein kinase
MVTPEGKLKTMWCHLRTQNQHLKFYQYFERGQEEMEPFYYSPEEVHCMYLKEKTFKLNFDKCNSFRLGMVLLRCLTLLDPLHHFYNPSMTKVNICAIRNQINAQVVPNYADDITNLVKSLLREDPNDRPSPMEIYEIYSKNFSSEFELKVCGKSEKDKK